MPRAQVDSKRFSWHRRFETLYIQSKPLFNLYPGSVSSIQSPIDTSTAIAAEVGYIVSGIRHSSVFSHHGPVINKKERIIYSDSLSKEKPIPRHRHLEDRP
jgi:hypothetical protein